MTSGSRSTARWPSPVVVSSSAPGQAAGDLLAVGVGNVGVVPVVNDQRGSRHPAGERGHVQLLPAELEPGFQVLPHRVVGPPRECADASRRRGRTARHQPEEPGEPRAGPGARSAWPARPPPRQASGPPGRVPDPSRRPPTRRARENWGSDARRPIDAPWAGASNSTTRKPDCHQRLRQGAEPSGPAAPSMSQHYDRDHRSTPTRRCPAPRSAPCAACPSPERPPPMDAARSAAGDRRCSPPSGRQRRERRRQRCGTRSGESRGAGRSSTSLHGLWPAAPDQGAKEAGDDRHPAAGPGGASMHPAQRP